MIDRDVFYQRLPICQQCEFWRGACLKGHPLQGPVGCPIQKFPPVNNAGYHPDTPVPTASNEPAKPCCGEVHQDIQPMTWAQAISSFRDSMQRAKEAGWKQVTDRQHADRGSICRGCTEFKWFQCRLCRCVVWAKAKLATEDCPMGKWPRL